MRAWRPGSFGHARDALIALAVVLLSGPGDAAPAQQAAGLHALRPRIPNIRGATALEVASAPSLHASPGWATELGAIDVKNRNTHARGAIRLYASDGTLDRDALRSFMRIACSRADAPDRTDGEPAEPLEPRLVQLAFRAAYHFKSKAMTLVSATRRGAHGKHGSGAALDFQLEGVTAAKLAAYVRTYPRAGVGIYTHPKTQYVHVDTRDRSYHWIDASPPGVTWRERLLADPSQQKRDASYVAKLDLPEAASE